MGELRLNYERAGAGPTVVLLHAGVGDLRMWDPQFEEFARFYDVVRFDFSGFGTSPVPTGPYSFLGDLKTVMDELDVERAALVGESMGAHVALEAAVAIPERVAAIVAAAPVLVPGEPSPERAAFSIAEEEAVERNDLEAATNLNLATWVAGPTRSLEDFDPDLHAQLFGMQLTAFKNWHAADPDLPYEALDPPVKERVADIAAPVLAIWPTLDMPDAKASTEWIAATAPGARLAVIEDAAHIVNMEKPAEFNEVVLGFLAEVWPPN
ncbi:MAG: alpha/beta fold hydrolase [Actinomycetota bacterium]